ncbi:MAG TPA: hypothetical protein VLJ59_14620 [Mycobacteriales bacterium]|nr:hypothetical protein [Mycobacteriales bacterium]
MTEPQPPQSRALRTNVLRKVISTVTVSGLVLLVTMLANVPPSSSVLLSIVVGGIVLLTQFLMDFESRLDSLEASQQRNLLAARTLIEDGFARVGEATRLFELITPSMFSTEELAEFIRSSSVIDRTASSLARDLARHESERTFKLLRDLSTGGEIAYEGEDREWLLGLAKSAQTSIDATSLTTVDAGSRGFDGGLWTSDLGYRYLDLQREAIARGVVVRRIFVFDRPDYVDDPDFRRILRLQRQAGILVRMLDESTMPDYLANMIFDFIVFDRKITYEMTAASMFPSSARPAIVTTHLGIAQSRVEERAARFERLWAAAAEIKWVEQGGGDGRAAQAGSVPLDPTKT